MRRVPRWRTVVTLVVAALLFLPVVRDGDDVPLSSYPMYATPRAEVVEFIVPVGIDANGADVVLSSTVTAQSRDPLIAEAFLRDEVRAGRQAMLCADIARRASSHIATIEIRREQHHVVDRVLGRDSLQTQIVLEQCPVR